MNECDVKSFITTSLGKFSFSTTQGTGTTSSPTKCHCTAVTSLLEDVEDVSLALGISSKPVLSPIVLGMRERFCDRPDVIT
jgi:hypothetical protein